MTPCDRTGHVMKVKVVRLIGLVRLQLTIIRLIDRYYGVQVDCVESRPQHRLKSRFSVAGKREDRCSRSHTFSRLVETLLNCNKQYNSCV